jgi:hypothetical protein
VLIQVLAVSGVIFLIVTAWVLVDRLFRKTVVADLERCGQDRPDCHHCPMGEGCGFRNSGDS